MGEYLKLFYKFLSFCKPFRRYGVYAAIITLILAFLYIPAPFITKYVIDKIFPTKNLSMLNLVVGVLFIFAILNAFSTFINGMLLFLFRTKVLINIQYKLFEHMEYLNMTFHTDARVGHLTSRLINDTSYLQGLMADTVIGFIRNLLIFFIGVGGLLFLHWKLALISMVFLPFFVYSIYFFSSKIRKKTSETQEKIALVYNVFFETLYLIPLVKAFCLEEKQTSSARNRLDDHFCANQNLAKTSYLSASITSFIGTIGALFILWLGGREVIFGRLSLGSFVAFNTFLSYLYGPVQMIMGINTTVQSSLAALKRVFQIFTIPKEDEGLVGHINLDRVHGKINFENVTFSYDGSIPVVKNICLTIQPNEKIALVGKSGTGKTTLVNLLLKFYKPQKGNIYLDNTNIKDIKFNELRQKIGIVQQTSLLFSGTIKENIRVGNLKASEADIIEAARIANLYDFVMSLPKGFNTEVGERGVKLSGGERQRLAIARVVLKNPKIFIFDEATSEIDSDSETVIRKALNKILDNKTAIFIAHRLFSVLHADRCVFIENGEIKSVGSHEQLYKNLPSYRKICDEQFLRV